MAIHRYIKWIYLTFILLIVVFIQIGIRTGQRPDMVMETESEGFRPMAQKIEAAKEKMKVAEEEVIRVASSGSVELEGEMVEITAGEFTMGDSDGPFDQKPERLVYLDTFVIGKNEVSFAEFYAFVLATDHRKPRLAGYLAVDSSQMHQLMKPENAVAGVSWFDALAYCEWRGNRLPTEAEWEKAARGTDERRWPWGNVEFPRLANLIGFADGYPYLAPVDAFHQDRSPYGVTGMAGNVMEWVLDWYQEDYYRNAPLSNPKGPGKEGFRAGPEREGFRVIRGASWNDSIRRSETTIRFRALPEYRDVTIGFRCVKQVSS